MGHQGIGTTKGGHREVGAQRNCKVIRRGHGQWRGIAEEDWK